MEYLYAPDEDFSDLAGGCVLRSRPGVTGFPARLASEIFGRCTAHLVKTTGLHVYDPCCGSGQLLTTLGFLRPGAIAALTGSDIDEAAVALARDNLALLSPEGLASRRAELGALYQRYGKASHAEAVRGAQRLGERVAGYPPPITRALAADALQSGALQEAGVRAHIVLADLPYGQLTAWQGQAEDAASRLLVRLIPALHARAAVALVSDKGQRMTAPNGYERAEKQLIGKRKFEIYLWNGGTTA